MYASPSLKHPCDSTSQVPTESRRHRGNSRQVLRARSSEAEPEPDLLSRESEKANKEKNRRRRKKEPEPEPESESDASSSGEDIVRKPTSDHPIYDVRWASILGQ